jgi:hypothetical protein
MYRPAVEFRRSSNLRVGVEFGVGAAMLNLTDSSSHLDTFVLVCRAF